MATGRWLIEIAVTSAAAGAIAAQPDSAGAPAAPTETAQPFAACEGQRFEFKAGNESHPTKITLCSKKDASNDELVRMLASAATKIQELDKLPLETRTALIAQMKAKIIEIQATNVVANPLPAAPLPTNSLPPNPLPLATPIAPNPLPMASKSLPMAAPLLTKPRLDIQCFTPGEVGLGGPCISLERDTMLMVRADENVAGRTSLRFLRKGDVRAELTLAPMRKGQSRRFDLPSQLCAGVASSVVEIQILSRSAGGAGANQVVDTLGPYQLRC